MTETPQSAVATGRWAGIPVNATPTSVVPEHDFAARLDGLERRLTSQPIIEQSKGVLMVHFGIGPETAFTMLRKWSSCTNLKVRDISQMIVITAATAQRTNTRRTDHELADLIDCLNQGRRPAASPQSSPQLGDPDGGEGDERTVLPTSPGVDVGPTTSRSTSIPKGPLMTESPRLDDAQRLDELTAVLAQMGAVVLSAETVDTTVELVTALAAETIADTSGAGVTLVDARGKRSVAASDPLVERADALQYEFDSGPCLTAWRDQVAVRIDDTGAETRWPQWTAAVAELDVRAMLSVPLVTTGASIGAIKVYSNQPAAYNTRTEHVLELFARQAAILLSNTQALADARRLSAQLTEALNNRDIIGQAKGVLMAQGADSDQAAFAMLVAASQRSNTKLSEVARRVIASAISRSPRRKSS